MKLSTKIVLDLIPFLIICISAVISFFIMLSSNYVVQWQHYLGFVFLLFNGIIFYRHHQLGLLFLGFTLFFGLIGILSFNVGIVGSSLYWTPFGVKIPLFAGNPILLVWLILHFVLSGRYYVGVITKQYWTSLLKNRVR